MAFFDFLLDDKYIILIIFGIKITFKRTIKKVKKIDYSNIFFRKINRHSVLIIEFSIGHGETIPSYIKYFKELGYNYIDIFVTNELINDKFLSRFDFKNIRVKGIEKSILVNYIFTNKNIKKYEFIFLNSWAIYYVGLKSIYHFNNKIYLPKKKIIGVEHHVYDNYEKNYKDHTIITLLPNNSGFKYVNPHYFGSRKCRTKNKVVRLVLAARRVESARNMGLLIDSVKSIVDRGVLNFELLCVGNIINLNIDIKGYENNIKYIGALNYYDFYNVIESSDFILPMLDPDIESHKRFLVDVSGTFQLVYGFGIIPIVHRVFSSRYGINNDNGLIYDSNDFIIDSLLEAINMSFEEYEIKRNNIFKYADILEKESLENLKSIL